MLNKEALIQGLIAELETIHTTAINAANRAHQTATDKQNVAENKYDTFGLEAAYLAEGQAKRVAQCQADIVAVKHLVKVDYTDNEEINVGALVNISDQDKHTMWVLLAPVSGGLKLHLENRVITVISPHSPLGKALLKKECDDSFKLGQSPNIKYYTVESVR